MLQRVRVGVLVASLVVPALVGTGFEAASASIPIQTTATTTQVPVKGARVTRGASLAVSAKQVTEGDRVTLTATITSPRQASKVTLQKWYVPLYYGEPTWKPIKTVMVHAKRAVRFGVVATAENTERYRVIVTYMKAKPFASQPLNVTVWRWIPLSEYDPYYEAESYAAVFGTTTINGQVYTGWGAASYSHTGVWESRFTPGRHCQSFRGVLGVADISADGSSGAIKFTADDSIIYESPSLTPGMGVPVTIPLAKPYRFGVQLFDTTPGGTTGHDEAESWPVIGEPALLCTGV